MMIAVAIAAAPASPRPAESVVPLAIQNSITADSVEGKASWYHGSRGFHGIAHVAMQDGRWTGKIQRYVQVCVIGGKCDTLPVVDNCQCHRGTPKEKVIDLSAKALDALNLDPDTGVYDVVVTEVNE